VTIVVAAVSSCSKAEGGSMILSPFRTGVSAAGSTENWDDHLSGLGLVVAVMADLQDSEDLLPRAYGRMRFYL